MRDFINNIDIYIKLNFLIILTNSIKILAGNIVYLERRWEIDITISLKLEGKWE